MSVLYTLPRLVFGLYGGLHCFKLGTWLHCFLFLLLIIQTMLQNSFVSPVIQTSNRHLLGVCKSVCELHVITLLFTPPLLLWYVADGTGLTAPLRCLCTPQTQRMTTACIEHSSISAPMGQPVVLGTMACFWGPMGCMVMGHLLNLRCPAGLREMAGPRTCRLPPRAISKQLRG
jgi:hypothetical protein